MPTKQPAKKTRKKSENVTPHARTREQKPTKKEIRALQVAQAMVAARTNAEISKEIGVCPRQVQRIKNDEATQIVFEELIERRRVDLVELWDATIQGAHDGIHATEPVITINEAGAVVATMVPDYPTRQQGVRNSISMFQMIFNQQGKDSGPMTITLENAHILLRQIRARKDKEKKK